MENEIYIRDYTGLDSQVDSEQTAKWERMSELLYNMDLQVPKVISAEGKAAYDLLLPECDAYCRFCHGKIYAAVDYQSRYAKIHLTLPTMTFLTVEHKMLLLDALLYAAYVSFCPTEDGTAVEMVIWIAYFDALPCGSKKDTWNDLINRMRKAGEKMADGDPALLEKIQQIFEEDDHCQTE